MPASSLGCHHTPASSLGRRHMPVFSLGCRHMPPLFPSLDHAATHRRIFLSLGFHRPPLPLLGSHSHWPSSRITPPPASALDPTTTNPGVLSLLDSAGPSPSLSDHTACRRPPLSRSHHHHCLSLREACCLPLAPSLSLVHAVTAAGSSSLPGSRRPPLSHLGSCCHAADLPPLGSHQPPPLPLSLLGSCHYHRRSPPCDLQRHRRRRPSLWIPPPPTCQPRHLGSSLIHFYLDLNDFLVLFVRTLGVEFDCV